jgi:transcriptional regulator with XRE-family HTH domain
MSTSTEAPPRAAEFAKRLNTACDTNPLVPALNFGRLTWMKAELAKRFGEEVSVETVRKWFAGESKPRADKLKLIAAMLEVDEAWLSLGISPDLTPREQRIRNATADGAVNLIAGLVQMGGGHPAFPEPGDKRAAESSIDIYAIIKGAQYAFHVALANSEDDLHSFVVPVRWEGAMQLGVIPGPDLSVRVVEIPESVIAGGIRRGGGIEVTMDDAQIEAVRIRSFAKRL